MKQSFILAMVFTLMGIQSLCYAQPPKGQRNNQGRNRESQFDRLYNPATVATITGTVLSIKRIEPGQNAEEGVYLIIKAEKGETEVYLGPAWFIDNQELKFAENDKLEITGSRETVQSKSLLLAAKIVKATDTLILRDEEGKPVWSSIAPARKEPRWHGSRGWGRGSEYNKLYNSDTVETLTGEITKTEVANPARQMSEALVITVKTGKEEIPVHLGPSWYIQNQDILFSAGDTVSVTGSRVSMNGEACIIAKDIKKNDQMLKLRDNAGNPLWVGTKRVPPEKSGRHVNRRMDQAAWGSSGELAKKFDPKTIMTFSGKITKVDRVPPLDGMTPGLHLVVQGEKETYSVHVGPVWYTDTNSIIFAVGDMLTLKGSKVTLSETLTLLPMEIINGEKTIKLRNEKGFPVWAGGNAE